jgi:hypothetical protein
VASEGTAQADFIVAGDAAGWMHRWPVGGDQSSARVRARVCVCACVCGLLRAHVRAGTQHPPNTVR